MKNTKIQMVDLKGQYQRIKGEIDQAIQHVIDNTAFINGPDVKLFSERLAKYHNVLKVITCGNCTDALQIAMITLGLKEGDEVLMPAFTYVAAAEATALLKLKPVFVDVDYETFNIDVEKIEEKISKKTRAIIPVHLFGQCADMRSIVELAGKYGLKIIEDNAQAIGAKYTFTNGKISNAGTMGDIGCLSFFPSKNLGCYGDGGAMLINDPDIAERARMIANHGQKMKYNHEIIGCNSRLDTLQAAILNVKLNYLDQYIEKRVEIANRYNDELGDLDQISIPMVNQNSTHVYHQYTIKLKNADRDLLKTKLQEKGIPSMIYYPIPLHLQKAYQSSEFPKGSLPASEKLSESVLSLPIHTEPDNLRQEYIIDTIKEILK